MLMEMVCGTADANLATQAFTNLGNALDRSYRWSEAFDAYVEALAFDRTNGVAAMAAAEMLLRCGSRGIGNPEALRRVAMRYAKIARMSRDRVVELAGPTGVARLDKLPDGKSAPKLDVSGFKPYLRFVAKHHLALVPTIEGLDPKLRRWDSLLIHSITEPLGSPHGPPPLLAMFNTIKAGYLAARRLAYRAVSTRERQTGLYADSLDYALYGTDVASLLLAQRAAIDILDQIAVALNDYLGLGLGVRQVDFSNVWRVKGQPAWRRELDAEIAAGNSAVVALGELAEDLASGFLKPKLEARNSSTHRFTVLHDEALGRSRPCEAIEHHDYSAFVDETIATLKAVRSAILYFVEIVVLREHRLHHDGRMGLPFYVPAHHDIRHDR
jgi:LA2681-like HEPN